MSGDFVVNVSKEKQVGSAVPTIGTSDTQVIALAAALRCNHIIIHHVAAGSIKFTIGLNGNAAAAATAYNAPDAVGYLGGGGARVNHYQFTCDEGDVITEVRAWASSSIAIGVQALAPRKSNNANF